MFYVWMMNGESTSLSLASDQIWPNQIARLVVVVVVVVIIIILTTPQTKDIHTYIHTTHTDDRLSYYGEKKNHASNLSYLPYLC